MSVKTAHSLLAGVFGLLALAACDTPLGARGDVSLAVSGALGAPVTPLRGGVYRFVRTPGLPVPEDSAALAADAVATGTQRPLFADVLVLQYHPASESYATAYGNLRFYPFEDDLLVVENFSEVEGSYFFPARIEAEGRQLVMYEYSCNDLPQAQRDAIGLADGCQIDGIEMLRTALAALDLSRLQTLRFEWIAALPDRD